MKKNKIRKTGTRLLAGIALAGLLVFNLQIGIIDSESSDLSLSELTISLFTPAMAATGGECGQGVDEIPCQPSAQPHVGYHYTPCGPCMQADNHRGTGPYADCCKVRTVP